MQVGVGSAVPTLGTSRDNSLYARRCFYLIVEL